MSLSYIAEMNLTLYHGSVYVDVRNPRCGVTAFLFHSIGRLALSQIHVLSVTDIGKGFVKRQTGTRSFGIDKKE